MVTLGDLLLCFPLSQKLFNLSHFRLSQAGSMGIFAAVGNVAMLGAAEIFKITKMVIGAIVVFVVNVMIGGAWAKESFCNKDMHF